MHCVGLLFEEIRENLHMSILVLVEDFKTLVIAKPLIFKEQLFFR